jgi:glycine cleavage system aminomethyltransferase T
VPTAAAEVGQPVEIEIFGEWIAGKVVREPLYDPEGEKIRAPSA